MIKYIYYILLTFSVCVFTSCTQQENTKTQYEIVVSDFLDTILIKLDTLPYNKSLLEKLQSVLDTNASFSFYPEEYIELNKHIKASLSGRFTEKEKEENLYSLLEYKISSEIEQYQHTPLSQQELKILFDSLSNQNNWNNNEKVVDAQWFNSDTLIILLGQSHSFYNTPKENREILKIQTDIFKLNEHLIEKGIDLFLVEGFSPKEIDLKIETKTPIFRYFINVEKYYEYNLDSVHPIYTYGYEDLNIHAKADSIFKLMLFTESYLNLDSVNLPKPFDEFKQSFCASVNHILDSLPGFQRNLDTTRLYDTVFSYTKNFETVDKLKLQELWQRLSLASNKLILNKRNEIALETTLKIMNYTNRNVSLLKIGNNHLHPRTYSNILSDFSDHLIPIQELCAKKGYSYIYLLTEDDFKKLY